MRRGLGARGPYFRGRGIEQGTLVAQDTAGAAGQAAGRAKPSIILASYPDQAGARGAALDDAAVTGTLTKPFDPRLLLERLETLAA